MEEIYIYPTIKSRVIFGTLMAVYILSVLVTQIDLANIFLESESPSTEELKIAADKLTIISILITIAAVILNISLGVKSVIKGIKTNEFKQYPPPGSLVLIRTKIAFGDAATKQVRGCYISGAFFISISIWLIYFVWSAYQ